MIKMRRSIQMRCISLVHFVLNTGIMMTAWLLWCAPLIDTPDAQTMSLAICACYMVFSIFLFRTYNAYKIGMYRAGEVFYAQTLANLFSSAITYLFACLIRLRLLPVWPVLAAFCGQTIVSVAWCLWANKLYFRLHPPMKTLVLYETDDDFEKLNEIVSFENRFDVQKKMKSPGTIYEILPNMSARRAVLRPEYAFAKRTLDALLAALGLVIASPVMLITAIALKAYDNGPVIYRQVRLTKDGKPSEILNVRCMGSVGRSARNSCANTA